MTTSETKAKLYKTAIASISCAKFNAGDYVAVKFSHTDVKGTLWYEISGIQHGDLDSFVYYPEHHLTRFCM